MTDLGTLLERAAEDLPETRVAAGAWRDASRRLRHRRRSVVVATAGVTSAIVVASVLGGPRSTPRPGDPASNSPPPSLPSGSTSGPTPGPTVGEITDAIKMPRWSPAQLTGKVDLGLPERVDLTAPRTPLSKDPVAHALLSVEVGSGSPAVAVLGDDGRWRTVDTRLQLARDSGNYTMPPLRPTSLSADGTRLAIPQPDELVVVDLTTGRSRRYAVPGYKAFVIWRDDGHVLVTSEEDEQAPPDRKSGDLVSLADGSIEKVPFDATTAFLPDGRALRWSRSNLYPRTTTMVEYAGTTVVRRVRTAGTNDAGLFPLPPLVNDRAVVGQWSSHRVDVRTGQYEGNGIVVVDRTTGVPLALLPTNTAKGDDSQLLGWIGDTSMLLGLPAGDRLHLVLWDYANRTLAGVSMVEGVRDVSVAVQRLH